MVSGSMVTLVMRSEASPLLRNMAKRFRGFTLFGATAGFVE